MTEPLLRVTRLFKRFGGVSATDDLSLDVRAGEIHALIGPNGAGKTTFIGQLMGEIKPDSGDIHFDGRDIGACRRPRACGAGIARTFQITELLIEDSALDNVALAVQAGQGHSFRFLGDAAADASLVEPAREHLAAAGLADRAQVRVSELSHGERKQLELAVALAAKPRLLLLDEPMAGLGAAESRRMVETLLGMKGRTTMLLVEHDMDVVFALADRISVLVYGRIIASGTAAQIQARRAGARGLSGRGRRLMLRVENLQAAYGSSQVLFDVSFEVGEGEVATLLGRNGMGKTTTIKTIMGLVPARGGRVFFDGQDVTGRAPEAIARLGVGLVPEGRQMFPTLTVRENLVATAADRFGRENPWTLDRVYALFPRLGERHGQWARTLSGGEQQMLAIGRALMTNPRLLILDEATEGLAPVIRAEIWSVLAALKAQKQSILVVDKNLDVLRRMADSHCVIEKGRIVWAGDGAMLDRDREKVNGWVGL